MVLQRNVFLRLLLVGLCGGLCGCGEDSAPADAPPREAPASRPSEERPRQDLESVENLTEAAANRLIEFSDALRKRDFDAAGAYVAPGFQGRAFGPTRPEKTLLLPAGVTRSLHRIGEEAPWLDARLWLRSIEDLLAPLESIERVFFKTRAGDFSPDRQSGSLRLTTEIIGRKAGGVMWALYGHAGAEVVLGAGGWRLRRFDLERYRITERRRPMFTDVASSAGLSWTAPRIGTKGNDKFYWRGAATADFDGDGFFDVFTSTNERNFLYRNLGNGTFEDVTEAAGLARPTGPTAPLFLDYDNDGDLDLFLAFVGWEEDGVPAGESLHLFRNDGRGRFTDVSAETGVGAIRMCAFSAVAADFDGDGWLDIFVCGYNRLDAVYPDSWYRATNGTANVLLRNRKGRGFVDVAREAGVAGHAWTYAAAAADFDEDGDQDLYVANDYGDNDFFVNRGDGTFENAAKKLGVLDTGNGMGAAFADLDGDGDLDLYVSNMSSSAGNRILRRLAQRPTDPLEAKLFKLAAGNSIFLQGEDGRFERLPPERGGISASWAWSPALLDIDLDGTLDIYVANGFISGNSLKDT